ncbi:heterokaryon incompatibility protein [Rutstroemia sp. NJR-2017a BBW]|nr:heterokaryon incompatibility protein [Rutstroemia sp. NJR-2017a BBW]
MSKEPIDWNRYNNEIEQSLIKHDWKSEGAAALPEGFRVIDVEREKVVLAPEHCQYVALSYVWGEMARTTSSALMLRMENVQQLAEDFSIPRTNLPATIRDAMVVCAKIGKRYLWVDCLCIVQDGHEDIKQSQIDNMGDIYASAFLTIVGASGDDARDGLAGIDGKPRLKAPRLIHFNKIVLTEEVITPFRSNNEAVPKWHTRGWRFQELLFSSRLLIFTEYGLCYQYRYRKNGSSIFEFSPSNFETLQQFDREIDVDWIRHMIEEYTQRHLTHDSDTFRAMSGIFHRFGIIHQSGIPLKEFDTNLLWRPSSWHQEIRTHDSSGTVLFPSWSWGSIIGPVRFQPSNISDFYMIPVAAWAHFSLEGGNFTLLTVTTRMLVNSPLHHIAHEEGMFPLECSDLSHKKEMSDLERWRDHDTWQARCEKCCQGCVSYNPKRPETYPQICMERRASTFIKNFSDEDINAAKAPGRLLLLTQTARLRLEYLHRADEILGNTFFLWDENAQWSGMLQLSDFHAKPIIQVLRDCPMTLFDFAAISICQVDDCVDFLQIFYRQYIKPKEWLSPEEKSRAGLFRWSSGSVPDWEVFF